MEPAGCTGRRWSCWEQAHAQPTGEQEQTDRHRKESQHVPQVDQEQDDRAEQRHHEPEHQRDGDRERPVRSSDGSSNLQAPNHLIFTLERESGP